MKENNPKLRAGRIFVDLEETSRKVFAHYRREVGWEDVQIVASDPNKFRVIVILKNKKQLRKFNREVSSISEIVKDEIRKAMIRTGADPGEDVEIEFDIITRKQWNDRLFHPPTDNEIAKAHMQDALQWRGLEAVTRNVKRVFAGRCSLYYFAIIPEGDKRFRVFVFFNKDKDVELSQSQGVAEQIKDFVLEELECVGRGSRNELEVYFEFDSHENVKKECGGNYYLRML